MNRIYLLASLPMLRFGTSTKLSAAAFIAMCREQLNDSVARTVECLLSDTACEAPFAKAWRDKESVLRNAAASHRARKTGVEAERWLRSVAICDSHIEHLVDDAFHQGDPLKRQRMLEKIRWLIADELQGPDPLCENAVYAYAVKLGILGRLTAMDSDGGAREFDRLSAIPPEASSGTE